MLVVTQLLLVRDLCAYDLDGDSICYCSALAFLFPTFGGTRHTFYADRAAAFSKYLRFSREIDWNNFSHTDSSPAAFEHAQPKPKGGGDFSSACALFSFLCTPRGAFRKFTTVLPGTLGGTNFRYF